MARDKTWKLPLLVLVAGAHLWLGWKLALYRPDGRRSATRAQPRVVSGDELLTVLTFEPSAAKPPTPARSRPTRRMRSAERAARDTAAAPDEAGTGRTHAPAAIRLDLRPPPPPMQAFAAPDPLRRRSALSFDKTRFDGAWVSDGNLTQVVARKSVLAGVLLGAMGALRKPCTGRERREYDPECVPDQYRHEESDD
jgi:hypothetical protein